MKEKIYVLVLVTYDYFRFQENLFAGTEQECINKINELFTDNPIYKYENEDTDLARTLKSKETTHYWLQKF